MTQQPRGSEVIARSIVMNVFSEFDPVDHTVFIPLDANTANALEGAIKYELDAKDAALLAAEKERDLQKGVADGFSVALFEAEKEITSLKAELETLKGIRTNALKFLDTELCDSHFEEAKRQSFNDFNKSQKEAGCRLCLKAELEAARSESKRIVAIAGKELLAAQAQNERLVLALKKIHRFVYDSSGDFKSKYHQMLNIAEEAISASPSTPIHEAIEGAIAGFEAWLEEMKLMLKEDDWCDHSVGICWCDYTKKLERAEEALSQLRKVVNKNG